MFLFLLTVVKTAQSLFISEEGVYETVPLRSQYDKIIKTDIK